MNNNNNLMCKVELDAIILYLIILQSYNKMVVCTHWYTLYTKLYTLYTLLSCTTILFIIIIIRTKKEHFYSFLSFLFRIKENSMIITVM